MRYFVDPTSCHSKKRNTTSEICCGDFVVRSWVVGLCGRDRICEFLSDVGFFLFHIKGYAWKMLDIGSSRNYRLCIYREIRVYVSTVFHFFCSEDILRFINSLQIWYIILYQLIVIFYANFSLRPYVFHILIGQTYHQTIWLQRWRHSSVSAWTI